MVSGSLVCLLLRDQKQFHTTMGSCVLHAAACSVFFLHAEGLCPDAHQINQEALFVHRSRNRVLTAILGLHTFVDASKHASLAIYSDWGTITGRTTPTLGCSATETCQLWCRLAVHNIPERHRNKLPKSEPAPAEKCPPLDP